MDIKKSDQMFEKLGYKLEYSNRRQTVYRKKAEDACGNYCIVLDLDGAYKDYTTEISVATVDFGWQELLACVAWRQEQEVTK